MRGLVVFESMFGNTKAIAEAVAEGLGSRMDVETGGVDSAPVRVPEGVSLLVVGGPTHAFGLSRPDTRATAAEQAGSTATSPTVGLREWLGLLGSVPSGLRAAAFDTRVNRPKVPGSAARRAEKALRRLGAEIATPATTFWVRGTPGPLQEGEIARARQWGRDLAAAVAPSVAGTPS